MNIFFYKLFLVVMGIFSFILGLITFIKAIFSQIDLQESLLYMLIGTVCMIIVKILSLLFFNLK